MLVSLDHSTRPVLLKFLSIFPTKIGRRLVERCSCCLKTTFSVKLRQISVGGGVVWWDTRTLSNCYRKEEKYKNILLFFCLSSLLPTRMFLFSIRAANTVITLPSLRSLTVKVVLLFSTKFYPDQSIIHHHRHSPPQHNLIMKLNLDTPFGTNG